MFETQLTRLHSDINKLEKENGTLSSENGFLHKDNDRLIKENVQMVKEIAELERENFEFNSTEKKLIASDFKVKELSKALEERERELRHTNRKYNDVCQEVDSQFAELQALQIRFDQAAHRLKEV